MTRQTYYPRRMDQLSLWHQTFSAALAQHATVLGISSTVLTQAQTDAQTILLATNYTNAVAAFAQEVVAWKEILHGGDVSAALPSVPQAPSQPTLPAGALPAIQTRTKALVSRIRTAPGYNEAIGKDLGIIGPAVSTATFTPRLSAKAVTGSRVVLRFTKGGFPAVRIECKRGAEQDWSLLAVATSSPFEDARPPLTPGQPEKREYRAQALDKNHPTGNPSGNVTVATLP